MSKEKKERIIHIYIASLNFTIIILAVLLLISTVRGFEYTGDLELCVLDTLGDEICLHDGDSFDVNDSRSYYMILQPKSEIRDIGSIIDVLIQFFSSIFIAIILLVLFLIIIVKILLSRN